MAFPCCMGLNSGVRVATLLSLLLALGLGALSFWLFRDAYDEKYSQTTRALDSAADSVNSVFGSVGNAFGVETGKVNPTMLINVRFFCSGVVLVAAALQALTSFLVFCCSIVKDGRATAKLYVATNTLVIFAIGAVLACFFTSGVDYKENSQIQYFIAGCIVDLVFLLYFLCVAGAFART